LLRRGYRRGIVSALERKRAEARSDFSDNPTLLCGKFVHQLEGLAQILLGRGPIPLLFKRASTIAQGVGSFCGDAHLAGKRDATIEDRHSAAPIPFFEKNEA